MRRAFPARGRPDDGARGITSPRWDSDGGSVRPHHADAARRRRRIAVARRITIARRFTVAGRVAEPGTLDGRSPSSLTGDPPAPLCLGLDRQGGGA